MDELNQFFQKVAKNVWNGNGFEWIFYVSVVFILFLEKKRSVKIVFSYYSLLLIFLLYNPVTYGCMKIVFGENILGYYCRLYELVPIIFVIALAMMYLVGIAKKEWIKLILLSVFSGLIIFVGTDGYTYNISWMAKAQNLEKVPDDAINICRYLHKDEGVTIAVPDSISCYIRQIDASFYMPYSRYLNELGEAISKEYADAEYISEESGKQGCDYIVVYANDNNRNAFYEIGWQPKATIGIYDIYFVEGVPRIKNTYDERRRLVLITTLDKFGTPIPNSEGYASVAYDYDSLNNRILEYYLDTEGEPIVLPRGYSAIQRKYTFFSKQLSSKTYVDVNRQPILVYGRYETRYTYNGKKKVDTERYFDRMGILMNNTDTNYAVLKNIYDDSGKKIGERYYDTEGKPVLSSAGYAGFEVKYDAQGNAYKVYFDIFGNEISAAN